MSRPDVYRISIEIMKGIPYGDERSFIPVTPENEGSWRRLEEQIAEIRASGGVVDLPGYENEYREVDPETGRWIEVPPPDSPAGLAAARTAAASADGADDQDVREYVTDTGDVFELPPRDRPSWAPLDVGRYGYPLPAAWEREPGEPRESGPMAPSTDQLPDPPPISGRFVEAVEYARSMHDGQVRKGTDIPYLGHLLAVAALAMEDAATDPDLVDRTEDIAIAAILHDVVEDTIDRGRRRVTVPMLRQRFGDEVASIVDGCSDATEPTADGDKGPWRDRKQAYVDHLAEADRATLCVSLADKRHNARCIVDDARAADVDGTDFWGRFNAGAADQAWYYGELASAFDRHRPGRAARELRRTVDELRNLAAHA